MRSFRFSVFPLLLFSLGLYAFAQSGEDCAPLTLEGEKLRVAVDVVDVYFTVKQNNQFVEGLSSNEFTVLENHQKQQIRYFSAESHARLSLGLLIDTSDSEAPVLGREREVARRFLDQVLSPGDEGLVVSFDSNIQLRQDFTGDHSLLVEAVARAEQNDSRATPELEPGRRPRLRSTALYDAIAGISKHRLTTVSGRKAIIIITDGEDRESSVSATDAIEGALKANAICYVLLVGDSDYMGRSNYKGDVNMRKLTSETGGRVIKLDKRLRKLERSLLEIASDLRHHYSIGYTPSNRRIDGKYRGISIQSSNGYKVQSRRGYYYDPCQ